MSWNVEDPSGSGRRPGGRRRASWDDQQDPARQDPARRQTQDPRTQDPRLQDPRLQQPVRADRGQQQPRPDRGPRPPMPQPDPRQAAPRPRPAGTASTGQHPVARTRETSAGPTGTARIPIVRQAPAGPAAPRPGVRRPEPNAPQPAYPTRSRLRTPPPAPPAQPRTTTAPLVPGAFETMRPASRPTPVQAFTPAAPARALPRPLPPTPVEFAAEPAPVRRRRGARALVSVLAVLGLMTLSALPAFASGALDEPPVAGIDVAGVQRLEVGTDVDAAGLSADSATGSLPVAAAPAWINPVRGRLSDGFGPRPQQPVPGVSLFHRGQDITAPCGRPIRASHAGVVTSATYWGTYGNWILIDGGDGVAVGYAHESRIDVSVGQRIKVGQVIGLVGQTGAATGCHLHLEVHLNGVAVNPLPFFIGKQVALAS